MKSFLTAFVLASFVLPPIGKLAYNVGPPIDVLVRGSTPSNVGDLLCSTDATHATFNSAATCGVASSTIEGWHSVTPTSPWINAGGNWQTTRYRKDNYGRVYIEGMVSSGTSGTAVFNLPAGYRPSAYHNCTSSGYNGTINVLDVLEIRSTGDVIVNGTTTPAGTTNVSLYCAFFP